MIFFFLCFLIYLRISVAESTLKIWPYPNSYTRGSTVLPISASSFKFISEVSCKDLEDSFSRYNSIIFGEHEEENQPATPSLTSVVVRVHNCNVDLQFGVDESYSLNITVSPPSAIIEAETVYGVYYGLETFSQLVIFDSSLKQFVIRESPWTIQDKPYFPYRGMLIDSVRHFLPKRILKKVIDSLSYSKFNTMHWHLSDNQAFVPEIKSLPKFWDSSYDTASRYTQKEIKDIIEYARKRGVRIIPEIDIPGHMMSWCKQYPEVCPTETCLEPLDPSSNYTFPLLKSLFNEISSLFPDDYIHLGGDEVSMTCWNETPRIKQWMNDHGYDLTDTYKYMIDNSHQIILNNKKKTMNWEEVVTHIPKGINNTESIIQIWLGGTSTLSIINRGFNVLISKKWYLDDLNNNWEVFYNNDPLSGVDDKEKQKKVLGGEACMWGETVDSSDIFNTIWPRAASVSERLWTNPENLNVEKAKDRLLWFRCLLNERGIEAAPVLNEVGRTAPSEAGGCLCQ